MNRDTNLIFEAYKKRLVESAGARGKISPEEFKAAKNRLRDGLNKLATNMFSSDIDDVVYTALSQYPTFSQEAKQLRDQLDEELSSIKNNNELRANWKKISQLGTDLLNASIWSFGENAEEGKEITVDTIQQAVEKSLTPYFRDEECSTCGITNVMDKLEEMGFDVWNRQLPYRDQFDKLWDNNGNLEEEKGIEEGKRSFVGRNAYCYDMNASDDSYDDKPYSENKIDKYGNGPYLFMEGSGRGPDTYLACEFAKKHGYSKLILNGLS